MKGKSGANGIILKKRSGRPDDSRKARRKAERLRIKQLKRERKNVEV
jgi:hypothetical protein